MADEIDDKGQSGQAPFEPTDEQKRIVKTAMICGMQEQKNLCQLVINPSTGRPIDEKTLRKHFRDELDAGTAHGDLAVLQSLYRQAVGAPAELADDGKGGKIVVREEMKPVVAATIFSAKARPNLKWSERTEVTGKDGGPVKHDHGLDLSKYTVKELEQLDSLLAKGGASLLPDTGGNPKGAPETQH